MDRRALALFPLAGVLAAGAACERGMAAEVTPAPPARGAADAGARARPAAPDAGATTASASRAPKPSGPPVCTRVGTRSEGWVWPGGELIRWEKCAGMRPICSHKGMPDEGWYARGQLVARAACAPPRRPAPDKRSLPPCGATLCDDEGHCWGPSPPRCR
jgi:hypothetical protein